MDGCEIEMGHYFISLQFNSIHSSLSLETRSNSLAQINSFYAYAYDIDIEYLMNMNMNMQASPSISRSK